MSRLVLGREVGDTIKVGEDVTITVLSISERYVRLLFDAPRSVQIDQTRIRDTRAAYARSKEHDQTSDRRDAEHDTADPLGMANGGNVSK